MNNSFQEPNQPASEGPPPSEGKSAPPVADNALNPDPLIVGSPFQGQTPFSTEVSSAIPRGQDSDGSEIRAAHSSDVERMAGGLTGAVSNDAAGPGSVGMSKKAFEQYRRYKRRQLRTSILLFIATTLSTFLVGSQFLPLELAPAYLSPQIRQAIEEQLQQRAAVLGQVAPSIDSIMRDACLNGARYAFPLMLILLCHEMGHFLQSVRYHVPASFPYFIPLPLPPLGTMGAVILQGRGTANRKQMFDIAVSGPLAGLVVTLPILYYGIQTSRFEKFDGPITSMEFGEPLLLTWMIEWLHHPAGEGEVFVLNCYGFAGWVGVFITAMNLLPIGQLDGGHILYTLIGKPAHIVALLVIAVGVTVMLMTGTYSYILLVILLLLTGARHPPTADDSVPLGLTRHVVGWATLAFLVIGFTPQPIIVQDQPNQPQNQPAPADPIKPDQIAVLREKSGSTVAEGLIWQRG